MVGGPSVPRVSGVSCSAGGGGVCRDVVRGVGPRGRALAVPFWCAQRVSWDAGGGRDV